MNYLHLCSYSTKLAYNLMKIICFPYQLFAIYELFHSNLIFGQNAKLKMKITPKNGERIYEPLD